MNVLAIQDRKILVPHKVTQHWPQLAHVASCGWWKGVHGPMWGHPSTNHNMSHGRIVANVVPLYVAQELLYKIKKVKAQHVRKFIKCQISDISLADS